MRAGHQTLEVNLVKVASTRGNNSKVGDGPNEETMESRGPKGNGKVKERNFARTLFRKTRPL